MRLFLVSSALVSLVTACAPGPDPLAVAVRLEECGLASEGEIGSAVTSAFYQPNACYRDCLSSASCEDLSAALCGTSIDLLSRCDQRCAHRCANGSLIAIEQVCDGAPQCADGSDEAGCPTFICDDGAVLSARQRCDGYASCGRGEDELGCGTFSCVAAWGGVIGAYARCDGYVSCSDESDERDCPEYVCANGMTMIYREGLFPRCDGWPLCGDSSDEQGCARLTPMCATP